MIRLLLKVLKETPAESDLIKFAKGANKYPESWKEFINYLKLR